MAYIKSSADPTSHTLVIVSLDPEHVHADWVKVPLYDLKVKLDSHYVVTDLLKGTSHQWQGEWNKVEVNKADPVLIYDICFRK
jgi:hypothetical protein